MPYNRRPRVIGLTMVKNEQDIIEPMIRHNAALLDALIVLDNGSVDDTRDIALALARECGNVVVTDSAQFGYTQGERMTRLLHAAQTSYFADFVLFLDADEFIGTTSRTAFHAELGKIPMDGAGAMPWHNFILPEGIAVTDPPCGLTHRRAEAMPFYKLALRLDGTFQPDIVVHRGSHAISRSGRQIPWTPLPQLPLWHFPIRGHAQLTAKALVGWLACLAADPQAFARGQSNHWQAMYERIVGGSDLVGSDLRAMSLHYGDPRYAPGMPPPPDPPVMHDPVPVVTVRRYSSGAYLDPLVLLARSWERSLRAPDPLFAPEEIPGAEIDIPPFRFLFERHRFASVFDGACGIGLDLELFARLGVAELAGVGPLPADALMLRRGGYVRHDPAVGFSLGRRYALVLCLRVAANLSPDAAVTLIANAARHAESLIVFCLDDAAAEHLEPWLVHWRGQGWVPDLMETLALRCLSSTATLRRGLVVLRRSGDPDLLDGTSALLLIARRPFHPPVPAPGIHDEPLLDPAEASWFGYAQ